MNPHDRWMREAEADFARLVCGPDCYRAGGPLAPGQRACPLCGRALVSYFDGHPGQLACQWCRRVWTPGGDGATVPT